MACYRQIQKVAKKNKITNMLSHLRTAISTVERESDLLAVSLTRAARIVAALQTGCEEMKRE